MSAACLGPATAGAEAPGMLRSRYDTDFLAARFLPGDEWRPFPKAADREAWESVSPERRAFLIGLAEGLRDKPWPMLPATLYMEYAREGNRSRYQDVYFQRREDLSVLVLAECIEHEGRFLDAIANALWAITEEATWCIPAHASRHSGDVLPRQDIHDLDLFACETGATLATAYYLLGDELEGLSRALCERLREQVHVRITGPYAAGDDFGRNTWLGGRNNWSPWCASNILAAALFLEEDGPEVIAMTDRLMMVVDRFIAGYGDDGGCDEGPGYWNEAGGAMLVFLELMNSRTDNGMLAIYGEPKIAAMGEYIARARLTGPWFANFADAAAKASPHPGKVYRYGERIGSAAMMNLALESQQGFGTEAAAPPIQLSGTSRALLGPLMQLFWIPADARPRQMTREASVWLPDVQNLFARENTQDDTKGLVLAAKGGHNAESHNHNDVGHFMLYLDGQPGIIDIGAEDYTAKTFSGARYTIWMIRGSGHNMPLVNGIEQAPGRQFAASQVDYRDDGGVIRLGMNIEKAYPEAAGLESLRRTFIFRREGAAPLEVRDAFGLDKAGATIETILYAALPVSEIAPGRLAIACAPRRMLLEFDPVSCQAGITPVALEDSRLISSWGPVLYRITLTRHPEGNRGEMSMTLRAEE